MERGGVIDVVGVDSGVVHGKTVVMFGGHHEVLHAALFGQCHDLIRIEIDGIERRGQLFVFGVRDLELRLNPFGIDTRRFAAVFPGQ